MKKIKLLKMLKDTYKSPISLALKLKFIGFPLRAITKSNRKVDLIYLGDIVADFLYEKYNIHFYHEKAIWTDPIEVFIDEGYSFLRDGKNIIDIGANIGDSPLYFVLSGFNKVIALEPMPQNFEILVKNVNKNHLDKIIPINAMLGKEVKYTTIEIPREITTGVQAIENL